MYYRKNNDEKNRKVKFTLIGFLVVFAMIAILTGILLPAKNVIISGDQITGFGKVEICGIRESIHVRENIFFNCEEDVNEESNGVKVL